MITIEEPICNSFENASTLEWLETNGIGGFAMGTVSGALTRRYHGLLTAATREPLGRATMLSKFEETLIIGDQRFELSTNRFPDTIYPKGFEHLAGFRLDPFPTWIYEVGGICLQKSLFMPSGENAVVCRWTLLDKDPCPEKIMLELRPLVSFTDYHHLQHEDARFDTGYVVGRGLVSLRPYPELPEIFFTHNAFAIEDSGYWYRNFDLAIEAERGFDHFEDLFQPFVMRFDLAETANVICSSGKRIRRLANVLEKAERKRRSVLITAANAKAEFNKQLVLAADQFIVKRGDGYSIIAGYPWFSDWGRDAMIALPGLTLATGRHQIAKEILLEYSKHISEGMLPNRFPDAGETPEYNTVDATLWYFEAIRAYTEATGDHAFVDAELYEKLADIVAWHLRGTRYNIHVDTDGLLYAGSPDVQLTWMDAKIGDLVITPRTGKPVEIQALWYNALRIMADFAERFGHDEDRQQFEAMADLAKLSFNGLFWNRSEQCLFDVVENGHRDGSVRPNQIFAISLTHPILVEDRWVAVVEKVRSDLLTPVGLRSLSPNDPAYVGIYTGSPFARDSAYHQGTVWSWLLGPFVDAFRKVYPDDKTVVAEMMSSFERHLLEAGLGQISEIFDGDAPHIPRGCPAQAWSVGEVLRAFSQHSCLP
ncbi:amylo-alpha-1,6-glucosidase [Leptolyngbya sp. 7M]|uniref:amylo-alpha-1,6-glucosidase n=1 Tax=Leptolyngbya sp. 7M TaxID=2812896 RepID=UPI001B8C3D65|nr:amylo-alpha-1,6-glucosidase [Leptolyngbya sp. 7M]QYO67251.1 amylo-alpha-1,6-glucosidase [Leptolyngbya sp. 7M]